MPKSRGGANEGENIMEWNINKHNAFHRVNQNRIITERIWDDIQKDWNTLTDEFKMKVWEIVNMSPQDVYKEEAFTGKGKHLSLETKFKKVNNGKQK